MPIFRHQGMILYFAHVPKCAGTSIENYLEARFGPAAFLDRRHRPGNRHNWSRSSPQHIAAEHLMRLFPVDFFDAGFGFVREPLARVQSAFHFHQIRRKKIPRETSLEAWLPQIAKFDLQAHARFDDHFRPQTEFVPAWCKVFRLEEGFDDFTQWLDNWSGGVSTTSIGRDLRGGYQAEQPSEKLAAFIRDYYGTDYERFGPFSAAADGQSQGITAIRAG